MKLTLIDYLKGTKHIFNKQYSAGVWDYLNSSGEEQRFDTVRNSISKYSTQGKILELGCGVGLLQQGLSSSRYLKFLGIDISDVAIHKAQSLRNEKTNYICADMNKIGFNEKFDIIVFNESLYYSIRPIHLIEKYMQYLTDGGVIITSVFSTPKNNKIINRIEKRWKYVEKFITQNATGTWYCHVLRK